MSFKRRAAVGAVLWSIAIALLWYGVSILIPKEEEPLDNRPIVEREISVNAITTTTATVSPFIDTTGTITSQHQQLIKAPHSGEIIAIASNFKEGALFKQGDLLLTISPFANNSAGLAQKAVAHQEIAVAQTTLKNAQNSLARQQSLLEKGIVNQQSVEQAEDAVNLARQSLFAKRATIVNSELFAQFDGSLRNVNAEAHQLVSANETVAELVNTDSLEISFRLSDSQVEQLQGASTSISVPITIANSLDQPSRSVESVISRQSITSNDQRIYYAPLTASNGFDEGEFAYVRIHLPPKDDAITVPRAAINTDNSVWSISEEKRLTKVPITLIAYTTDGVIIDGIPANMNIVAQTQPHLGEGLKVRINGDAQHRIKLSSEQIEKLSQFVASNDDLPQPMKANIEAAIKAKEIDSESFNRLSLRVGL